MWPQGRNYWKDNKDMPEAGDDETEHAHCDGCYKIRCQYKSRKSCSLMHCPLSCGAVFHACKASEHKELCSKEFVPCVNLFYGCKQSMRRSERGRHLATCPASVVYCTMEWNRWPVFSRERQERVPFAQKNLHARYGQLDVALAMRDQRILYEAMKAPRRVRRSLRNRLTERFPAVPLTSSHSTYVEGSSVDAAGATSDEDAGGDAPWDLLRDPPGLQRSICKELFKTDSGSLHLDALDAQGQERNGSESSDKCAHEGNFCRDGSEITSCSGSDEKDTVSTSLMHFQGCDMVGLPVSEGHTCSCSAVPTLSGDINASHAGELASVAGPALLPNLCNKPSEEYSAAEESLGNKIIEAEFCSEHSVFVSSLADVKVKAVSETEGMSYSANDVKLASAFCDEISSPVPSSLPTGASEKPCSDYEKVETIGDILEGRLASTSTSESGYIKQNETESSRGKDFSVENTCEKLQAMAQTPPDMSCVTDQLVTSCSSMDNVFPPEHSSKLSVALTIFDADETASDSSRILSNFSTNTVDSDVKAVVDATSLQQHPCLKDNTTSLEENSSLSGENSCSAISDEALINPDRLTDAKKGEIESKHPGLNECQGMSTDAVESLEFRPDLVFLGIDVASVSSLYHHNAVVFLPPTGGTIANPGTVVVDLPKEYHNMVEGSSVPPPAIPPPLTLQEILALDLNLESITRYQAKPRSMYTFLCAQNFRRDEYPWHFKNVHSEIHGGLSGWIEARCPLACYGCTYSTRRLNPVSGTVLYNSEVDCFGVRPNSSHSKLLCELSEGPPHPPVRLQKEATPEIYTSKDYDSAVNIKCRSYVKENELLEGEPRSGQTGFTSVIDGMAQNKGASADNYKCNADHDVFPPSDDLSKFDTEIKVAAAERCKTAENHDVFPSCSDSSAYSRPYAFRDSNSSTKDDIPGALLACDNMTNDLEGAVVRGLEESFFLRMLPFEVLQHIARRLDSFSLCNLAMTSRFLREVCRSIVEHRGIVIQEWEKKQFDSGSSWQVTYQRWLFSSAFTPCEEWRFEDSPSISEHLKVCPFNVMAEPRSQPFQLCCLSMSEDDYRNHEAERMLQKMYPEFDPKSIQCADSGSRMPGAEVLDHLYVNEIGKSGFSGYKRALKSFAQSCLEQFRDTPEEILGMTASEQFGESLEPEMAINTSEHYRDCLEQNLGTNASEQFHDYLEPKLATKSPEQFGDDLEPQLEIKTSELFGDNLESKLETKTLELSEYYLEPKLVTSSSETFKVSYQLKPKTKTSEQPGASLEPKLETNTFELLEDSLAPKLETIISEQFRESMEPKLEKASEEFGDYLESKQEENTLELFENSVEPNLKTIISERFGESME